MKYTTKSIKRTLEKNINEISVHPELFVKNPGRDFTRTRKLSFKQTIKAIVSMSGKSLRGEIMDYFNMDISAPTVSAFVQQRNKISYHAFETLFHSFTNAIDEQKLYRGYRLLAVDGSDLHTPTNRKETDSFYQNAKGHKPFNILHLNALYDINRNIYIDAIVQPIKFRNEHRAFVSMVDRDNSDIPTIYIADRGYESYNNMAHVIEKGQKFLFRVKDIKSHGIVSGLPLPDEEEFDITVSVGLTRNQSKDAKNSNLKFIAHTSPFDYLPTFSRKNIAVYPYYMTLRIVRFKLSEGVYEVLISNLSDEEFSTKAVTELYSMRWGIETSFRSLKYTLSLRLFHSKKTEYILQEIFAKLTMYNFAELITSHVVIRQKCRKLTYNINFSAAIHICRIFFLKNISPSTVETLLLQHLLPVRKGLSNPRNAQARPAVGFSYRIP